MNMVLEVSNLSVLFHGSELTHAVHEVSFGIEKGEVLALVGETGCGKSVIAHAIMSLLPSEAEVRGEIMFRSRDLLRLSEKELSAIRGRELAIVFQNPSLALNPVHTIGRQVAEPFAVHRIMGRKEASGRAARALERMGFSSSEDYMGMYPSQCSGGMNQRFVIAASTILNPPLVIADEPTKGLDSSLVDGVCNELQRLVHENNTSLLLITHDLAVARRLSDRIAVMYSGEIIEMADTEAFFENPLHPYSRGLLMSLPENGFVPIPGTSPSPVSPPPGCRFQPRCTEGNRECAERHPDLLFTRDHYVRCFFCH